MRNQTLRRPVVVRLAWLGLAAVSPLAGQTPTTVSDRIDVRLVEVDAWAHDGGRPVLDLRADELRLFEDGRRVEILFFTPPESAGSAPAAPAAAEVAAPPPVPNWRSDEARNSLAVFLDDAHISPANRHRVVMGLADWFERRDNAGTDVTVARYDRDLEVVLPRTSDPSRVATLLRSLDASGMRAVEESLDGRRTLDTIRQMQRRGIQDSEIELRQRGLDDEPETFDAGSVPTAGMPCTKEMMREADDWADRVERSGRETLAALNAYAASLAALPGRKVLLFVSDGIPSRPGGPAYDLIRTLCDGSGASQGIQDAIDVASQPQHLIRSGQLDRAALAWAGENRTLGLRFAEVAAQANASGVTVWTYSASGLTASGEDASVGSRERTPGDQSRQKLELEALMSSLAIDTGGRALLEVGDLGGALDQLDQDLDSAYLLAFAVPRASDGKLHKIKLETTRKGVRLRHRESWRDTSGEEDLLGLVQGALLHGIDRPGLGASVGIGKVPDGPKAGRPMLRVVVPEAAMSLFPREDGTRHGVLRVALAVQAPGGKASKVRSRAFPIALPALGPDVAPQPIVHDIELPDLPAGAIVAVGLRDELDGETGVLRLEVGSSAGES